MLAMGLINRVNIDDNGRIARGGVVEFEGF
jgi:hypothetical protein